MISVKNVKVNKSMSHETLCFSCDIYENGKLVAHVENNGFGGSNNIYPAKNLSYKEVSHLDSIDNECLIMDLVEETYIVKTKQSSAFVMKKGEDIYTRKFPKPITTLKKYGNFNEWLSNEKKQIKEQGFELLNTNI
jgi:hypothetical protein